MNTPKLIISRGYPKQMHLRQFRTDTCSRDSCPVFCQGCVYNEYRHSNGSRSNNDTASLKY